MSTVAEIKAAIRTLSPAKRAELERWLRAQSAADETETIPVRESDLDPEVDSPELEAELLKAANSPMKPYSSEEMRAICERIVREHRNR